MEPAFSTIVNDHSGAGFLEDTTSGTAEAEFKYDPGVKYDRGVRALCEEFATTYMQHETSCGATRFEMEQDRRAASDLLNFVLEANKASEIWVGDLGCGDGRHERSFRGVHRVKYVGVDVAGNMVQETARWAPKALLTQADASQLPFRAASFDLLLLTFGFCSFGGRGAIAEAARVLRDGGFAMFSAYNRQALNLLLSSRRKGRAAAQINPGNSSGASVDFAGQTTPNRLLYGG